MAIIAVMLMLLVSTSCDAAAGPNRRGGPDVAEAPVRHGAAGVGGVAATDRSSPVVDPKQAPREGAGCHWGWCWKWCDATAFQGEWCYTTSPHSSGRQSCTRDNECRSDWGCHGICSLGA